jgi:hypothetical protein
MEKGNSLQETLKKEQASAALELLNGMADLQDTLSLEVTQGDSNAGEKDGFDYAGNALMNFANSEPIFLNANPRSIRDEDRKKILPGQHGGVYLAFSLKDGTILKINFWGGLRTVSGRDLKDQDINQLDSHTRRTDAVAGQSSHLNWQISLPGGPVIDSWVVYNPNNKGSFRQSVLEIDETEIPCQPWISADDPRFRQIKEGVFGPIEKIIKLVPSSV